MQMLLRPVSPVAAVVAKGDLFQHGGGLEAPLSLADPNSRQVARKLLIVGSEFQGMLILLDRQRKLSDRLVNQAEIVERLSSIWHEPRRVLELPCRVVVTSLKKVEMAQVVVGRSVTDVRDQGPLEQVFGAVEMPVFDGAKCRVVVLDGGRGIPVRISFNRLVRRRSAVDQLASLPGKPERKHGEESQAAHA